MVRGGDSFQARVREYEKELIRQAMNEEPGLSQDELAKRLKMPRGTLRDKLLKYGIGNGVSTEPRIKEWRKKASRKKLPPKGNA